ncbi:unnamed protein product [Staurois parvus]|uniref:Uncharacterized protein n=1 Tax=Staurois parvus TaxID=386267 RepID=A0ABN9CDS8_9NEOB|nr:unnamed protein product [Staurois parvus]
MFFSKEHNFHINYATKLSVCCKLPPELFLFLLAGDCHLAEAQSL